MTVEDNRTNKIEGFVNLSDDSRCGNCGSYNNLLALAIEENIKGLPVDTIRIACYFCYNFSVKHGRLPKRSEL